MTAAPAMVPEWAVPRKPGALDESLERVLRRVRLRAIRRTAWLRKLWSEEDVPGGNLTITHGEVDTVLLDKDSPAAESAWLRSDPDMMRVTEELTALEWEMHSDEASRLTQLIHLFQLNDEEVDLFQACLAVSLDPSLGRVYAYLQDMAGRGYVTEELVGRLFSHGRRAILRPESDLFAWRLVLEREAAPGEPTILGCDPTIRDWLTGQMTLDRHLRGVARYRDPLPPLENWPVAETARLLRTAIGQGTPTLVRIVGPAGSGRRTLAAAISRRLDSELLVVDADAIADPDWLEVSIRAQRHALLTGSALAWHGETATERTWPQLAPVYQMQFVISERGRPPQSLKNMVEHRLEMAAPSLDQRKQLWHRYLPASREWEKHTLNVLCARTGVTIGMIVDAGRSAAQTPEAALTRIREQIRCRLGDLIETLECPFGWADLIVSDHVRVVLEDLVFEATERANFWELPNRRRLFPQGRGLFALLAGPPGVGKTMAAQVVAKALNRELYRIDLSRVISKYVGDSSRNVRQILSGVPPDEVLLFDEADALFGKRINVHDAHDRYANTDTNYLLQAIENHQGLVLLATNRRQDVDPAFTRRLRYLIDLPAPTPAARLTIWRRLVEELAGAARLQSLANDLPVLADRIEVTGAQIKHAVLTALLTAARSQKLLAREHLVYGLERELQKTGVGVSDHERRNLMRNG